LDDKIDFRIIKPQDKVELMRYARLKYGQSVWEKNTSIEVSNAITGGTGNLSDLRKMIFADEKKLQFDD